MNIVKNVLCWICQPPMVILMVLCCVLYALRFHLVKVFINRNNLETSVEGTYWDKDQVFLSPPTNTTTSLVENWITLPTAGPPPKRDGHIAWKVKWPQGMNAKEFPCMKNIFNKPLSCQECFVVCWPKGEKYVNNVGYCHTKYGNIVTSELWCASGNA